MENHHLCKSIVNMQFSIAMLYSLPECTKSVSFIQKKKVHLDILLPGHLPAPQVPAQPTEELGSSPRPRNSKGHRG